MIGKVKYKEFIVDVIIPALILALLIRTFVVQAFKIPSESMVPTLQIGDHLFVCKFSYGIKIPFINKTIVKWNSPKRGEIIVFRYPEDPKRDFIKRVIGLPEENFQVVNKEIYINGTHLIEPYKIHNDFYPPAAQFSPRDNWERGKVVLSNKVFVMGDNRDSSLDSRFWGQLDIDMIKGKALFIYWPPWRIGLIK
ncbi:MAG: signal peptidase I [bacterium]|nr:signal peptidase I [bacterium]